MSNDSKQDTEGSQSPNTKTGRLTLVKAVSGGTAANTDWTLSAAGPTPITDVTTGTVTEVCVGDYALSETTGPAGYTASDWVCPGAAVTGNRVTIVANADITCTITSTFDDSNAETHSKTVTTQETHGDLSPNVNTGGGDANIHIEQTINQTSQLSTRNRVLLVLGGVAAIAVVIVAMKTSINPTTGPDDPEVKAQSLELYNVIEQELAKREDITSKQAHTLWTSNKTKDAKDAEDLLESKAEDFRESFESSSEEELKKAASLEFILGSIKFMNLDYEGASNNYKTATKWDKDNHEYWNNLGLVYLKLAEHQLTTAQAEGTPDYRVSALDSHNNALKLRETRWEESPTDLNAKLELADSYGYLGWTYYLLDDGRKAQKYYEDSLLYRNSPPQDKPNEVNSLAVARTYNGLGNAKALLGEQVEAIKDYQSAQDRLEPYVQLRNVQSQLIQKLYAQTQMNMGIAHWYLEECGELKKAIDELSKAAQSHEKWVYDIPRDPSSFDHPEVARTYYYLGLVYWEYGDVKNAKKQLENSQEMYGKLPGDNRERLAEIDSMLKDLDDTQGSSEMEGCE